MSVIIREFTADDCEGIFKLNRDEMGYQYPLEDTKEKLLRISRNACDKILVAVVNGNVVGYVHANDYDVIYAPHMKNIMGIAVSEEWKACGIGRALLDGVEEWARKTGAKGIRLVSGSTRTGAHEFYRHCGYGGDKLQLNLKKMF